VIIPYAAHKELLIELKSDKTIKAFTCLKTYIPHPKTLDV
jgi:hypothetical protein